MSVDLTAWNDALYIHYDNDKKYVLCDLQNPTLSSIEKDESFPGRHASQGLIYQIGGGGSASLSQTITNSIASIPEEFVGITRKKMYEVALLDNDAIEASESSKGGFAKVIDEIDRKMQAAANRVEARMHRGRGGWIGRIASGTDITNAAVITLDDKADAYNFYKGQKICFSSTDGTSGSLRDSGEALTVASVQRQAGTVTVTTDLDEIASIADTDYIFTQGDFGEGILSFYDWVSFDRTILGTSFFGVTRSDDPDRLAGLYYDGTGEPYLETLTRVVGELGTAMGGGGHELVARCHPDVVTEMTIAAQGKMQIDVVSLPATRKLDMGMKTHALTLGASRVILAPTWASRTDRMIVGKADTWKLKSNGSFPKFLNRTGALHMMESEDTYQSRIGGYGNLFCKAPGWNCAVKLAAVRTA
jgi:hypothetical protein